MLLHGKDDAKRKIKLYVCNSNYLINKLLNSKLKNIANKVLKILSETYDVIGILS